MEKFIERILSQSPRDRNADSLVLFVVLECYKKYFPIDSPDQQDRFQREIENYLRKIHECGVIDTYTCNFNLVDFQLGINIGKSWPFEMKHFEFSYRSIDEINEAAEDLVKLYETQCVIES